MEIEVLRPRDLTAPRLARWAELQAADPALDSPFLSPGWARAVERAQGENPHMVKVAVAREAGRDLAFLTVRTGVFSAMAAGAPMCDCQGLVAEPGFELDPRRLVQALGVQRFDFCAMRAGQAAFAPFVRGRDEVRVVEMGQGYAAYAAGRREAGSSVLKACDKKRRKAGREAGPVRFTAHSRARGDFDALRAWKSAQFRATGQTDVLAAGWTRRLVGDLFASRDPDFGAVLFTLHFGDALAAVHLHLRGRHTLHGWLIAHDPKFAPYSPGVLLFQDILRWMEATPYHRLDLGPGDDRFKRELATATEATTHGFVGLASPAALLRESLPLGAVPEPPGKAMRRWDLLRGLR